jgi:lipoprotein-anchoring transpeptidase ErfK/SrfK
MPIGTQEVREDRLATRADGRRTGANRQAATWLPGSNSTTRANEVAAEGGRFSEVTGFSISGAFQAWYDSHEGPFYMGAPISEPHTARGVRVQYYENGILMEKDGYAVPAPLPRENPLAYGFDPTPVEQGSMPVFSEALFVQAPNPFGVDVTAVAGRKRIEINISEQILRAYQGDTLVLETYVSTGLEPNDTEIGNFHVRIKFEQQDMAGFTSETGEVVGIGNEENYEGTQTAQTYEVSDVPHVLYINYEAEALHGAYWHNNFGQRMSHGCINLPLDAAAFIYEFAPLGTPVDVIE